MNTMDTLVAGGMQKELNAMGVADGVIYWGCNGRVCDGPMRNIGRGMCVWG